MVRYIPLLVTIVVATGFCKTHLSGNIGTITLTSEGNPHVVEEDIVVQQGDTLLVEEGCVLLFKPFTDLVVEGSIVADGTNEKPVVFTSFRDGEYSTDETDTAEPFDWNGIDIKQTAQKVKLSHFRVSYSVYGIKSSVENVFLKSCIFHDNGQYNLTIDGQIQDVLENQEYSNLHYTVSYDANGAVSGTAPVDTHTYEPGATMFTAENEELLHKNGFTFQGWCRDKFGNGTIYKPGTKMIVDTNIVLYARWEQSATNEIAQNNPPVISRKQNLPMILAGGGLLFGAASAFAVNEWRGTEEKYLGETRVSVQRELKDRGTRCSITAGVLGGLSSVCLSAGVYTFFRNSKRNYADTIISIAPDLALGKYSLIVSVEFPACSQ